MSERTRPVVAVIPHYNNADSLAGLIVELGEQNYDDIYVIDDASTKRDEFEAVRKEFAGDGVVFMQNPENIGAGRTRNRILEVNKIHQFGTLLHFLDSDVVLETPDSPAIIEDILVRDSSIGMLGGLVKTPDGRQHPFNFGSSFTLAAAGATMVQAGADYLARRKSDRGENTEDDRLSKARDLLLPQWPNTSKPPEAQNAFWVLEANLAISSFDLDDAGGFTPMRAHDVQGLAIGLAQQGLTARFDPRIAVTHLDLGAHKNSSKEQLRATRHLIKRYGTGRFILGDTVAG